MAGKQLITEEDVRKMAPGGVLRLDSGTIATPAALDAAFARGIRVQHGAAHSKPTAGGALPAKTRECLWHGMLEQDGTYIVQVVNGRARVSLLTAAGPAPFGTDSAQEHLS